MAGWRLAVAVVCAVAAAVAAGPVAQTNAGLVEGYTANGADQWLNVPYAEPPLGDLRFRAPRPPKPWSGVRECVKPGEKCAQTHVLQNRWQGSEDCLHLNIYRPAGYNNASAPLPVLFWVHGGGFITGSTEGGPFGGSFNASLLSAEQNIVVVETSYRMNSIGFLAIEAFEKEDPENGVGNFGFKDQRLALQWVQDNIANFGGSPSRVMLMGQSAGAVSVCAHLFSPASAGLFQVAMAQSSLCDSSIYFQDKAQALSFGARFAEKVGCPLPADEKMAACLRSKPLEEVLNREFTPRASYPNIPHEAPLPRLLPVDPYGIVVDGTNSGVIARPLDAVNLGLFNNVTVVLGSNEDEGSLFAIATPLLVPGISWPLRDDDVFPVLEHFMYGNKTIVEAVMKAYPRRILRLNDANKRIQEIIRDAFFVCPSRAVARALATLGAPAGGQLPRLYHFNRTIPGVIGYEFGDYHGAEIRFVFGNADEKWVHQDYALSHQMRCLWAATARTGDPNSWASVPNCKNASIPNWLIAGPSALENIVLDAPVVDQSDLFAKQCDFWDSIGYGAF